MDKQLTLNRKKLILLPDEATNKPCSNHQPPDFRKQINLLDGGRASIRPILSDDKKAIVKFFSRLSADTRFLRYHYSKNELTDSDLKNFCDIDYSEVMALVVEKERLGRLEIIGVGRYYRIPPDHTAEIAMVVQDDEQQKGIGTQLLRHLATLAWRRDIHHFTGEVLRQNGRMLSIFRKADPQMKQEVDSPSTCTILVSVAEAMNGTKNCLMINSH